MFTSAPIESPELKKINEKKRAREFNAKRTRNPK